MKVICIRQDEHDVLVVARIPDGCDAKTIFRLWSEDPDVRECLDDDALAEAHWEVLPLLEFEEAAVKCPGCGEPMHKAGDDTSVQLYECATVNCSKRAIDIDADNAL